MDLKPFIGKDRQAAERMFARVNIYIVGRLGSTGMALKSNLSILAFSFILILLVISIPGRPARAMDRDTVRLPVLEEFVNQVKNGKTGELRGVYVPEVLAMRVVQQPASNDYFVSSAPKVVTQFAPASRFGSTGLLAHNFLAGESFSLLEEGEGFYLVYGDGQVSAFTVTQALHYQALDPDSTLSEFLSLDSGDLETASEVFAEVYNRPGRVIFQTCISANGDPSWGRLFVIAEPQYNARHASGRRSVFLRQERSK